MMVIAIGQAPTPMAGIQWLWVQREMSLEICPVPSEGNIQTLSLVLITVSLNGSIPFI